MGGGQETAGCRFLQSERDLKRGDKTIESLSCGPGECLHTVERLFRYRGCQVSPRQNGDSRAPVEAAPALGPLSSSMLAVTCADDRISHPVRDRLGSVLSWRFVVMS